jgi:rhodanese-related sulfurtransferase
MRGRPIVAFLALVCGLSQGAAAAAPASETCAAGAASDAAGLPAISVLDTVSRRIAVAAADCTVSAAALAASATPYALVDVRSAKDFAVASIPGSMNLRLESLANHLVVKTASRVVLIGDGKNTPRLLRHCALLRERGLAQIGVLDGGIPAWLRAGGRIAGDASALDQPLMLSERDLHELMRQPETLLVLVEGQPTPALAASGVRIARADATVGTPKVRMNRLLPSVTAKTTTVLLLPKGENPAPWRSAARKLGLSDPLFFVGAASRYDAYLEQQARMAEAAKQPLPGACGQG